jgi:2-desacetyl-2-hydroxyethyl bacteriochlorophyllide A dehydrogenase
MKTRQIIFPRPYEAELIETECRKPGAGEVTVELAYSAVSAGTERANLIGDKNVSGGSDIVAPFPRSLGYSAAGIVAAVGEGVSVNVGDRVIVYGGKHMARITVRERSSIVKLDDDIPLSEASLMYIATFPLAAVRKTRLELGEAAMVMGLGILGQFAVQLCKAAGGCPVIAADPKPERRALAEKLGADCALDPTAPDFPERVFDAAPGRINAAIEVTGRGEGFIETLDCMARFGRIALLGCTRDPNFTVDYYKKIHYPGITVIGAHTQARPSEESYPGYWTHRDDIAALLRLRKGGRLNFAQMINEIHPPENAPEVYRRLAENRDFPIGLLFDWTK